MSSAPNSASIPEDGKLPFVSNRGPNVTKSRSTVRYVPRRTSNPRVVSNGAAALTAITAPGVSPRVLSVSAPTNIARNSASLNSCSSSATAAPADNAGEETCVPLLVAHAASSPVHSDEKTMSETLPFTSLKKDDVAPPIALGGLAGLDPNAPLIDFGAGFPTENNCTIADGAASCEAQPKQSSPPPCNNVSAPPALGLVSAFPKELHGPLGDESPQGATEGQDVSPPTTIIPTPTSSGTSHSLTVARPFAALTPTAAQGTTAVPLPSSSARRGSARPTLTELYQDSVPTTSRGAKRIGRGPPPPPLTSADVLRGRRSMDSLVTPASRAHAASNSSASPVVTPPSSSGLRTDSSTVTASLSSPPSSVNTQSGASQMFTTLCALRPPATSNFIPFDSPSASASGSGSGSSAATPIVSAVPPSGAANTFVVPHTPYGSCLVSNVGTPQGSPVHRPQRAPRPAPAVGSPSPVTPRLPRARVQQRPPKRLRFTSATVKRRASNAESPRAPPSVVFSPLAVDSAANPLDSGLFGHRFHPLDMPTDGSTRSVVSLASGAGGTDSAAMSPRRSPVYRSISRGGSGYVANNKTFTAKSPVS